VPAVRPPQKNPARAAQNAEKLPPEWSSRSSIPLSDQIPFRAQPMLATLVREPFHKPGWVYEEKYDGFRILAYKEGSSVHLYSRNAIDRTDRFYDIAAAISTLRPSTLLLDGEVSVFDREGVSRFQLLQNLGTGKSVFAVFDCLYKDGQDLRHRPLSERRVALEESLAANKSAAKTRNKPPKNKEPENRIIVPSSRLSSDGLEAYRLAIKRKFEGLVAKDLSSPYVEGRSSFWLKVKVHQEDEFVIGGFTEPSGSRSHFGALLLGAYDRGKLHFVGKVGTGFNQENLAMLFKKFRPLVRQQSPFVDPPRDRAVTFLSPKLVAQISYQEWTTDKKLRQPIFLGLRDDKSPQEVRMPEFAA
jgi:bifunctional non-homologous end joining protein LigD